MQPPTQSCTVVSAVQRLVVQRVILGMKLATTLGVAGAIILGVIKETRGRDLIVLNRNFVISQVVCFAAMSLVLTTVFAAWTWRIVDSYRRGMVWSVRRKKTIHVRLKDILLYSSSSISR